MPGEACSVRLDTRSGDVEAVTGGATDPLGSPMTPITVPTATVESAGTLISRSVPATGDGTSVSTLSVAISTSGS